jgi:hypothetical protein
MDKQDNSTNKFELNYSNSEFHDRHPGCDCKPKQTPLEWHHWDDLYEFFRGYFNHFGDDISGLDKETFERMVKTIWRMANVRAIVDTREECKKNQPTFSEQLAAWADTIRSHNDCIEDETDKTDAIGPFELWEMVMHAKR